MIHRDDIDSILLQVADWPSEERVALAYQIIRDMRIKVLKDAPRSTFANALGMGRGDGPPPTDEDVRQIMREHRDTKYNVP